METVSVGFRCEGKLKNSINELAKSQGLSPSAYISNSMQDIVDGKIINRSFLQYETLQLIKEINSLRTNYPDIDLSELEKVGEKLCHALL